MNCRNELRPNWGYYFCANATRSSAGETNSIGIPFIVRTYPGPDNGLITKFRPLAFNHESQPSIEKTQQLPHPVVHHPAIHISTPLMVLVYLFKKKLINTVGLILLLASPCLAQDIQEIQIANEYLTKGEKVKALEVYQALVKNPVNIPLVHSHYLGLLLTTARFHDGL